eukprot:scaffold79139_cov60-Phaeocystis_antarctica.AAC.1
MQRSPPPCCREHSPICVPQRQRASALSAPRSARYGGRAGVHDGSGALVCAAPSTRSRAMVRPEARPCSEVTTTSPAAAQRTMTSARPPAGTRASAMVRGASVR